ncbi:14837_t:CDS:2 [Funneliformis geosporum]|uniref:14837_t:CDS:1 n=1 Tax=Funneliformis geosporum TaxID=1117311 RepID=A0A9W4SK57_9GLOM|nr:14837_t:CDS:2 [Funneliformis geosporum]
MSDEYESVLLVIRECYVYQIPPRTSSREYKASEWGDMEAFLWKGRLRVISVGEKCIIKLEDGTTGELFAQCIYDPDTNTVEPVRDSSRYFVLRVEDNGRHAFVGMGFQERSEAHLKIEKEVADAKNASPEPKKDYSLKEGQTISIKIGNHKTRNIHHKSNHSKSVDENITAVPLLPPPPSAAFIRKKQNSRRPPSPNDFSDFSDFTDSTNSETL